MKARVVCLPFAGGSADAYRPWSTLMPQTCELIAPELPGHGRRLAEQPHESAADVVADLLPRLGDPAAPLILFGHSMGGLLAHELCHTLCELGTPPRALVISAMGPPELLDARADHELADDPDALLDHVAELGATPAEVLADPQMRALVLHPLQADFRLLARARTSPTRYVTVPLYALAGDQDVVHPPGDVAAWQRHARQWQGLRVLAGGHFFPWQDGTVPRLLASLAEAAAADTVPVTAADTGPVTAADTVPVTAADTAPVAGAAGR
ncbi:alpha/beta fold hydrolase [Streptomyces sp. NPDC020362]|uniref:thioesterase II family protein n=1 Tax=unclassified Streptomyces TaxID=2593676 RepID=UPI000AFA8F66